MPDDPVAVLPGKMRELIEVDRVGAFGFQIAVEEGSVAYLIQGVAGNVLRAVAIEIRRAA